MADDSTQKQHLISIDKKIERLTNNPLLFLSIIGSISFLIRMYYFPYQLPIVLDGTNYFWYAIDMSLLGTFPEGYRFPNNGWPALLSIFFSLYRSENFLDYMELQRYVSMTISVVTIVPLYFLLREFFDKSVATVGTTFFAFEPRLIQNSLLGITEPFFILLGTLTLLLFLSKNSKAIYASFGMAALFTIVRYEGFLLLFALSAMFFVKHKIKTKSLKQYFILLTIFLMIILPMMYVRTITTGHDGVISHVVAGPQYYQHILKSDQDGTILVNFIVNGIVNFSKQLGWSFVPYLGFFVIPGFFLFLKNRSYKKTTIIAVLIVFLLPSLYAYSRNIPDTRYLYIVYPIFCLFSLETIQIIKNKFSKKNIIYLLIISVILFASLIFLDYKKVDYNHEHEAYAIALEVNKIASGINDYYPEAKYAHNKIDVASRLESFPVLSSTIQEKIQLVDPTGFTSIIDFINFGRENGLTHLVIDDKDDRPQFLKDVFNNDQKYPYLHKVFDSTERGFSYKVKIYEIDYKEVDSISN